MVVLCCAACCAACGSHHAEEEHHHHHEGVQYAVYTDDYEVFVKAQPFAVGEESKILVHLTSLADFKPVDSAKVTLSLIVGKNGIRQTVENCDGIYTFILNPEHAGKATMKVDVERAGDTETAVFGDVEVFASHEAMHSDEHRHAEEVPNSVNFPKERSWKIDFSTVEVVPEKFGEVIKTAAQVLPSQGDEREVSAKVSGIVVFANAGMAEGKKVSAGERLFTIESSGMADNNMDVKFSEAASNYNLAKAEYERKQKLAVDKIVSQSELNRARADLENAEAVYENLKRNFSRSGQTVTSPMSGYLTHINVNNGGYVEAGQPVAVVSQNREMFVRAELQPRYFSKLDKISAVSFTTGDGERFLLSDLDGGLVSYARSVDNGNPLVPVTFRFSNRTGLLSGSFVTLYIRISSDEEVVAVPNEGIVEEMGNYFVFVQINPELFEKRAVELGGTDGLKTVVKQGLKTGERVVGKGAVIVKLAQQSGALDPHAGHVH